MWVSVLLAMLALFAAHRAALWAESRGWLYYRTTRPPPGAAARAANLMASFVHPETEHVVEYHDVIVEDRQDGA